MENNMRSEFQDFLPVMADKLDVESFVGELCKGFKLLADPEKGLITSESLRRNSALLGMEGMSKEDAEAMVREGDLDGDGVLNENEFCILMAIVFSSIGDGIWMGVTNMGALAFSYICLFWYVLSYYSRINMDLKIPQTP
ncbi:hypothetical protein ACJW30_06G223700 [Castanea mollissima]